MSQYGKSTAIYKFEKIKRAKRAALAAHPETEIIDLGVGEPDEMAFPTVVAELAREARKPANRGYADNGDAVLKEAAGRYLDRVCGVKDINPETDVIHSIGSKAALSILPATLVVSATASNKVSADTSTEWSTPTITEGNDTGPQAAHSQKNTTDIRRLFALLQPSEMPRKHGIYPNNNGPTFNGVTDLSADMIGNRVYLLGGNDGSYLIPPDGTSSYGVVSYASIDPRGFPVWRQLLYDGRKQPGKEGRPSDQRHEVHQMA